MSQPLSTSPLPGLRDFFPDEMSVRTQVFSTLYRVVESFGYQRYDGPMLEPLALYAAKSGGELVSQQTYLFTDRGGREVVMRPEMTPTVARMIAAKAGSLTLPARWYSHPNLYRYERATRGRKREHWQVNADVFGTESWEAEAEIFELLAEMMFALGATGDDFALRVSDRQLMEVGLTGFAGVAPEQIRAVYGVLDALDKVPEEETARALAALGVDADKVLALVRDRTPDKLFSVVPDEARKRSNLFQIIEAGGLVTSRPVELRFDPTIIRGFDYYTSTVFEVYDTSPENRRAVAGGGRYDNLVGIFGKQRIPGLGFGMGDVTLIDFLGTHGLLPEPRLAPDCAVMTPRPEDVAERRRIKELAAELRQAGLRVTTSLEMRKLGKLLEKAAKEGTRFAVIAGEDEAARGMVKLRDLARSEEREVPRAELAKTLREAS